MDMSSLAALARDHVLYTLQDTTSGTVQGLAFVKKGQTIKAEQVEFIPLGDTFPAEELYQVPPVFSEQSKTCPKHEADELNGPLHPDSVSSDKQLNNLNEPLPTIDEGYVYSADLNLSETSSTNETTLDECNKSQASFASPPLLTLKSVQNLSDCNEDVLEVKPKLPLSSHQDSIEYSLRHRSEQINTDKKIKTENISKPSALILTTVGGKCNEKLGHSSGSSASIIISGLAAEVLSKIKSSSAEKEENDNPDQDVKLDLDESNQLEREKVLMYFEEKRNAKTFMSEETFNQLSKPFKMGWTREAVVRGSREITHVFYMTPSHTKATRRRLKSITKIKDYLVKMGETNLTVDNFSMRKTFLGFQREYETVRDCLIENSGYVLISFSKTGGKYDHFFEIVNKSDCIGDKRIKCLLCEAGFTTKGNFGRHMKISHEPDETCKVCGKEFRPLQIQEHRAKCRNSTMDQNENEVKLPEKRKSSDKETEISSKSKKEDVGGLSEKLPKTSSSNLSKPVAIKSCPSSQHVAANYEIDKSVKLEPKTHPEVASKVFTEISVPGHGNSLQAEPNSYTTANSILVNPVHIVNTLSQDVNRANVKTDPNKMSSSYVSAAAAESKPDQMATLVMTSEEGVRVKMQVKVTAKVVKGMKKFGLRVGVGHESLRFLSNGVELSGEEFAGVLDGANIFVVKR